MQLPEGFGDSLRQQLLKEIHTIVCDAVKEWLIPITSLPDKLKSKKYINEAEILNKIVFGCNSKKWRSQNPEMAAAGYTLRSCASIEQLRLLHKLATVDAQLMEQGEPTKIRKEVLKAIADEARKSPDD